MSSIYIPSDSLERKDCEALHTNYIKGGKLGKGAYGEVYQACLKGTSDCGYVLKVSTYDRLLYEMSGGSGRSLSQFWDSWRNEVKVFRKLNECQVKSELVFSPILYDAWYCNEGGKVYFYILMEKFDGDLYDLLEKESDTNKDGRIILSISLRMMDSYLSIIHKQCKICLNDIKLQNILYKKIGPSDYILVFSDFGISSRHSDETCIQQDRENFKRIMDRVKNEASLY